MCFSTNKIVSVFLTVAMLFSIAGVPTFAEEAEAVTETIEQTENVETEAAKENEMTSDAEEITVDDIDVDEENPEVLTEEIELMSENVSLMSTSTIAGDGTTDNPYLITTEADLLALANEELVNSLSSNYELQNDIVVTSTTWVPIGNSTEFSGHFDGNGYTISGVILEGSGYQYTGFFGKNSGLIENLTVDVTFSASSYLGGLAAYNTGTIRNCLISGTLSSTSDYIGGLIGENNNGTVKTSGSTATVTGSSYVGGLIGVNRAYYGSPTITNCYAQGNVTGSGSYIGGLVGRNYRNYGDYSPVVRDCYAAGKVNDGEGAGLIGGNNGRVYNCYYRSINTGNLTGYSISTTNMKSQDTFYMWDFDNIWEINDSYPYINVRGETEAVTFNGAGTKTNPYLIETEKQLFQLSNSNTYMPNSCVYFKLVNDVTITAKFWTPIGEYDSFAGVFDGNGYTISGVTNSGTDYNYVGLFGNNAGTIKNLTVVGDVSGQSNIGILAGYNSGTIENCLTKGTANNAADYVGGLVGENNNGTVKTSGSTATVTGYSCVGGLIGVNRAYYGSPTITNCYAQGNVTGSGSYIGGLVGRNYRNYGDYSPVVRECYAAGKVNDGVGAGLIGGNNGRVYNCYYRSINTGNLTGYSVSTTNMRSQDTFYMWDFDNIWEMNGSYPYINVRGETPEIEFDGDGDVETPYYVETEEQLYALAMGEAKTGSKIYYQLVNDIAITAKFWTPIGEYDSFVGVFDGNGYTISGVTNSGTDYDYVGLFGNNAGTIKNLIVVGDVSGQSNIGILAGYNSGTIENCLTKGTANSAADYVGGLVGENNNGTVKTSGSTATVTGYNYVGGLIGVNRAYYGSPTITNCYAQGNVTGSGNYIGGLVGRNYRNYGDYSPVVQCCYSVGVVSGSSSIGGLVGYSNGTVTASYYNSETSGQTDTVNGTPVATNDMKSMDTYAGWDFDAVWAMSSSIYEGYPYLQTIIPVEAVAVTGVKLNKSSISLPEGNSETLTATITPTNATNYGIIWTSSDTSVATVSSGKVVAKAAGTATITVTTVDGGYTASCIVTVTSVDTTVSVTGVTLNKLAISLEKGKSETLTATVAPADATDKTVAWKSSNTSIATVTNGVVKAISAGTAIITATTSDGGYTANCTVTVTENGTDENAPKITISDVKTRPGNQIQVTVDLENNTGFASMGIEVGYNSDVMTLTNVTSNSAVNGTFTPGQNYTINPFNMGWDSASNINYNGNLATLTFTVNADAPDGIYPITLDYYKGINGNYEDGKDINYDEDFNAVGFVYISGNVVVASYTPGDLTGDGKVNNKDATYLLRYLAGWQIDDLVMEALDVDASGTVNNKDATIMLRYLAGWDIELH